MLTYANGQKLLLHQIAIEECTEHSCRKPHLARDRFLPLRLFDWCVSWTTVVSLFYTTAANANDRNYRAYHELRNVYESVRKNGGRTRDGGAQLALASDHNLQGFVFLNPDV